MTGRRKVLKSILMGTGALISTASVAGEICGLTPAQTEGPFYPIIDQDDKDWDLTKVQGRSRSATGEVVFVRGVVQDENCKPIEGAMVEIWQACHTGKYNHKEDPNPAKLDPNFGYWGRSITDKNGNYLFKTIIPGAYPATNTWTRPPHLHYKVHLRGFEELTTQMYFKGHPLNKADRILNNLSRGERDLVMVDFKMVEGKKTGVFNLSLKSF
jgi:protocatechuate 3,4-dioxygenase beta subunit